MTLYIEVPSDQKQFVITYKYLIHFNFCLNTSYGPLGSTPSLLKTISSRAPYKSPATYSIFSESSSPQTSSMEEQLTPLYITVGCLVGFSVLLVSIMFFSWTILIIMRKR